MNKKFLAAFRIVIVLMLTFSMFAFSTPALADDGGNNIVVEGQDDAFCETPYYITGADDEYVVNPDNVIDCDVELIQSAVDAATDGDTIVLSGTFNLGTEKPYYNQGDYQTWQPDYLISEDERVAHERNQAFWDSPRGTVFIIKDLKIKGKNNAKIIGGYAPLTVGMEPKEFGYELFELDFWFLGGDATFVPVEITIENIAFEKFAFSGILVVSTRGTVIADSRFEEAQLLASHIFMSVGEAVFLTGGIHSKENYPNLWAPFPYQPGDLVYGDVVIKNNYVDGNWRVDPGGVENLFYPGMLTDGCSMGLSIFYAKVNAEFKGNTVKNCESGIGTGQWGTSVFKNNHVEQPDELPGEGIGTNSYTNWTSHPGPYYEDARAVIKDNTVLVKEGGVGITARQQMGTIIKNNTVTGDGEVGIATWLTDNVVIQDNTITGNAVAGIATWSTDSVVIRDNKVSLDNVSWGAIDLEDDVYNAVVKNNKITGSGRSAVRLGWPGYQCENNTIAGNKMKGFTPVPHPDDWGITTIGSHIELLWGAADNTITNNEYSAVDPDPNNGIQNIYFAGEIPSYDLQDTTDNVVREGEGLKIMDYTDPAGPLYNPDTYAGLNDILLGHYDN